MLRIFLLPLVILYSSIANSQSYGDYMVVSKPLDSGMYNPKKVSKSSEKFLLDEEADRAFEKLLHKDKKLMQLLTTKEVDDEGNTVYIREQKVYKYYPDLGVILEIGGHGYPSVYDIKRKKSLCGDPATYAYSPSKKFRLSGLNIDGMYYFLEKKEGKDYVCLGRVYFEGEISGYYWDDEATIHYLKEEEKEDGTTYRKAYSCSLCPIK